MYGQENVDLHSVRTLGSSRGVFAALHIHALIGLFLTLAAAFALWGIAFTVTTRMRATAINVLSGFWTIIALLMFFPFPAPDAPQYAVGEVHHFSEMNHGVGRAYGTAYSNSAWIATRIAQMLRDMGYEARVGHGGLNYETIETPFSVYNGLGEYGRLSDAVVPSVGGLRFKSATILTDFPMQPDPAP